MAPLLSQFRSCFDATFTGASAIEISLMEHELMNSDSGVTLEMLWSSDVHTFLKTLLRVSAEDTEHPGQLACIFKDEI